MMLGGAHDVYGTSRQGQSVSKNTPESMRAWRKRTYSNLRRAVFAYLGGGCVRCGNADQRVLQIDHTDGGGRKERAALGSLSIYRAILKGKPGYQLLCANCHAIKTLGEW
jgi:hypothetical protein